MLRLPRRADARGVADQLSGDDWCAAVAHGRAGGGGDGGIGAGVYSIQGEGQGLRPWTPPKAVGLWKPITFGQSLMLLIKKWKRGQ
jgi:hypothetical protein